ncbi:UNVERIFIED_CONTAM: hypothetical protein FKN15_007502 [Acipenser sinensis]
MMGVEHSKEKMKATKHFPASPRFYSSPSTGIGPCSSEVTSWPLLTTAGSTSSITSRSRSSKEEPLPTESLEPLPLPLLLLSSSCSWGATDVATDVAIEVSRLSVMSLTESAP